MHSNNFTTCDRALNSCLDISKRDLMTFASGSPVFSLCTEPWPINPFLLYTAIWPLWIYSLRRNQYWSRFRVHSFFSSRWLWLVVQLHSGHSSKIINCVDLSTVGAAFGQYTTWLLFHVVWAKVRREVQSVRGFCYTTFLGTCICNWCFLNFLVFPCLDIFLLIDFQFTKCYLSPVFLLNVINEAASTW